MMSSEAPLVSIIVATYNSADTIIDTLNSINEQTYHNIELIVTDDNSKDKTCDIVSSWIYEHQNRFVSCRLIQSDVNTGVSANFNRGLKVAKGEWIKPFGGDDILFPNYVDTFLQNSSDADMLLSSLFLFKNDKDIINNGNDLSFVNKQPSERIAKYYARIHPFFNVPTIMVKRVTFDIIGYYDEGSPYFEDVPFIMKFFKANLKAKYIDDVLVWYRVGGMSHQDSFEKGFRNNQKLADVCERYLNVNLKWSNPIDFIVLLNQKLFSYSVNNNCRRLYRILCSRYNFISIISQTLSLKSLNR